MRSEELGVRNIGVGVVGMKYKHKGHQPRSQNDIC